MDKTRRADPFAETVVLPEDELQKLRRARWKLDPRDGVLHPVDDTDDEPKSGEQPTSS